LRRFYQSLRIGRSARSENPHKIYANVHAGVAWVLQGIDRAAQTPPARGIAALHDGFVAVLRGRMPKQVAAG